MNSTSYQRAEDLAWRTGYFAKQSADEAKYLTYWAEHLDWRHAEPSHAEREMERAEKMLSEALATVQDQRARLAEMRKPALVAAE